MRGISKAIQRGPQQVKNIITKNSSERDLDFSNLEENFNKIQTQIKNLLTDSDKFKKTVENMLKHQEDLGKSMLELYKPISIGESPLSSNEEISKRSSVYSNHSVSESAQGDKRKIEIYLEKTQLMKDQILPHLQNVNVHVIEPMKGYQDLIHSVKQVVKKRSHKALDYDRHKEALDKLNNKANRSLDEERKLNKTREAFTTSELEYNTYNDQLKQQLPTFFDCSANLYDSCLITFYSIQKDVYHILYAYLYETANECGLNLNTDIIAQYESHNCSALLEECKTDSLNRLLTMSHTSINSSASTYPANTSTTNINSNNDVTKRASLYRNDSLPSYEASIQQGSSYGAPLYQNRPAPVIPPKPTVPAVQYVTALYDFTAQSAGDISFKRGDRIEIIKKTNNVNEWWTGKVNGQVGQFPGNYVQ